MEIVWFLLIGLAAGWIAGQLVSGGGSSLIRNLVVGVLGAFVGGSVFRWLGVSAGSGLLGALISAVAGAVILLFLIRLVVGGRSR